MWEASERSSGPTVGAATGFVVISAARHLAAADPRGDKGTPRDDAIYVPVREGKSAFHAKWPQGKITVYRNGPVLVETIFFCCRGVAAVGKTRKTNDRQW